MKPQYVLFFAIVYNLLCFSSAFTTSRVNNAVTLNAFKTKNHSPMRPLADSNDNNEKEKRRIVRYDNVGDPIYEGDGFEGEAGLNILGVNVPVDAPSLGTNPLQTNI